MYRNPKPIYLIDKRGMCFEYNSIGECCRLRGLNYESVLKCLHGKMKKHKGYEFEYVFEDPNELGDVGLEIIKDKLY